MLDEWFPITKIIILPVNIDHKNPNKLFYSGFKKAARTRHARLKYQEFTSRK